MTQWPVEAWRGWSAAGLLAAYGLLCLRGWMQARRARHQAGAGAADWQALVDAGRQPVLVAYASQTGNAEALARETAGALAAAGCEASVQALEAVTAAMLAQADRALWVLSTYGEGDPPDHAVPWCQAMWSERPDLSHQRGAVLALGDRSYAAFAQFGKHMTQWLRERGVQADGGRGLVLLDGLDADALAQWSRAVEAVTGVHVELHGPQFARWRLTARNHLNPGSLGGEAWHVELQAEDGAPPWQSGDLLQLRVPGTESMRTYSIASVAEDGAAHLLVRLVEKPGRVWGLGSGWLCRTSAVGDPVSARVLRNAHFHLPPDSDEPLILLGAGSGIAGLRGHWRWLARHQPRRRLWLVLGERQAERDRFYAAELDELRARHPAWQVQECWSRQGSGPRYVQDALQSQAQQLRDWARQGACILVCGSAQHLGQGVLQALRRILGEEETGDMLHHGRLRMDVY